MISEFQSTWSIIFEKLARKQSRYRYYFNLFYVAITRAQRYLCFVEQKKDLEFYKDLQQASSINLQEIRKFSEVDLWINQLENNEEAWTRQAKRYEDSGNYEQAIDNYRKAGIVGRDIQRCQMKLLFERHQYEEALTIALVLEDKDMTDYILMEIDNKTDIGMLAHIWRNPLSLSKSNGYQQGMITQLIHSIYKNDCDKELIMTNIIKGIDDSMLDRMNNLYSV
jgi:tetratricopeptide (TPR) repeat protein